MTPIYGRPICHDPWHDPVTARDVFAVFVTACHDPLTEAVTVFSGFFSVKPLLSRLSRRHGYLPRNPEMYEIGPKMAFTYISERYMQNSRYVVTPRPPQKSDSPYMGGIKR